NWIGSTTDDEFYEACDQYGIMIWDDFWLNSIANLPNDIYNFNMNAVEKIKRFRNHPAIAIWCGDNEGFPEPPLSGWLQENIKTFDGGDRYFQPNSKMPNLTGSGPWTNTEVTWYFAKSPNGFGGNPGWGLRSEIGTAVFTNFESFKKFMPKEDWWPRNEMWNKHFFGTSAGNASPDRYDAAITKSYGAPDGIEDYCRKAQLLNIETNKAMYEGWLDNMWEDASGILTWMSQSAYPSFVWQTYDYYYDLNGAYWGAKKACEPLHIQWNPVNNSIKVINTTRNTHEGLTAELEIYNKDGKRADEYSKTATIGAAPSSATKVFDIPFAQNSVNIALGKPAYASTVGHGEASLATDGRVDTRWASLQNDREWIYVDLGKEETVTGVGITWEEAYGRGFRIEVSNDAKNWDEVYSTSEGNGGVQKIAFDEVKARYVRMAGILRASGWGYSIWEFEVYGTAGKATNLSDVHFIKLKLKDKAGKLVSDNFYWRGNKRSNYTGLGSLPQVNLKVSSKTTKANGKYMVKATITNPALSAGVAVAVRVQAVKASNGEQILPVFTNDNYFSLVKGESKDVWIEFDEKYLGANDSVKLLVEPYNKPTAK
ncbi:MAG: beta-mannosidase, partial [Sphingobacteriales bacterium]